MDSDYFMLYPVYIDSTKTRDKGRKYSKENTVSNPKYQEMKVSLDKLNFEYKAEPDKRHPRDQTVSGRFLLKKDCGRKAVLSLVAALRGERAKKNVVGKGRVPNLLNLVPIKKKKGKNKK